MRTVLLTVTLLMFQGSAWTRPWRCDEHCLRNRRQDEGRQARPGDRVSTDKDARIGRLIQNKDGFLFIVYPNGDCVDATISRIVVIERAAVSPKLPQRPGAKGSK